MLKVSENSTKLLMASKEISVSIFCFSKKNLGFGFLMVTGTALKMDGKSLCSQFVKGRDQVSMAP